MNVTMAFLLMAAMILSSPVLTSGEIREIKVGIFTIDPKVIGDEGKVADYLSRNMGVKFVLIPIIEYEQSVEKLVSGEIDAGIFGSAPAFISIKRGVAESIARPEVKKSSVYYGYWLTLKESGLNNVAAFKGKRFAYVAPYTSAGYLFPRAAIKEKGFDPDDFFGTVKFSKTHETAIQMLLNGSIDGCAAKDTAYKKFIETNIELKDRLNILEVGGPFPERTLMVSKKIDKGTRDKIKDILLNMDGNPEGRKLLSEIGRDRYIETKFEDFAAIGRILDTLKIRNIN